MIRFNSVRFKISFLYTAILGLILIIYSVFLYLSLHYTLYDELDEELNIKAMEIAGVISSYLDVVGYSPQSLEFAIRRAIWFEEEHTDKQGEMDILEGHWLRIVDRLNLKEDYITFLDSKGRPIVCSDNLQKDVAFLDIKTIRPDKVVSKTIKYDRRSMRVISIPFSYKDREQYILQVATSLKPIIHLLQVRLFHIVVSIPFILIIASFFGRLFAKGILTPVMDITKTASNITHEDLSARVRVEHVDEEMRYLVSAFNDMIARLEESFKYIAEFSSHVAHELKTPLAIIKGECELTLRRERSIEEYKNLIKVNLEEAERMLRIINDLLLLTQLHYSPSVFKFERFDLAEFLKEICEQVKILASRKNISITIDLPHGQGFIKGDRFHLRRLFFNVLDNSVKFTPEEGRIGISLKLNYKDKEVIVSISDTGIGISRENIPKIFDRFYRVDCDNQKIEPGTGLGLSISQSIAKIHEGNIYVESEVNKGATFIVTIPLL